MALSFPTDFLPPSLNFVSFPTYFLSPPPSFPSFLCPSIQFVHSVYVSILPNIYQPHIKYETL